jgi:2-hydroxy-3-keto-5-methylthiopentenyl-1-phosphate phosphatase
MDLSQVSVFVDFDGTISTVDIGEALLQRFGVGDWQKVEDLYAERLIGSRECITQQFAMLRAPFCELLDYARSIPLDPGFEPLCAHLRSEGATVKVVSDGFGFYVEERCRPFNVEVLTNQVSDGEWGFPYANPLCSCVACGTCKVAPIEAAKSQGQFTVFIGDGPSDRHAAALADWVFAKESLAGWCREREIDFTEYQSLQDVLEALQQ